MTKRRSARQRRLPGSPPRIAVATSTAPTTLSGHDAAMPSQAPSRAAMRWTSRIVPVFIFVAFGYAIYAIIPYICVDYLYRRKGQHGTAIALIVLSLVYFLFTIAAYIRTLYTTYFNPGIVPLNERRKAVEAERKALGKREREDLEAQEGWMPVDQNPDSPGLEAFYSRDVFACEQDGRPKWCSLCWNWKPDRAHHSSELQRCIRKMDHLCPWVGGMVSETSFNFFFQFTFHCSCFLAICVGASAHAVRLQMQDGSADGRTIAVLTLAAMFMFFAMGMTVTSGKYILENITNIDALRSDQEHFLAVRVPLDSPSTQNYWTVTYPLPRPEGLTHDHNGNPLAPRDESARKTFAVVRTNPGENPWDLGPWGNFKTVMGNNPLEWMLPIRHSPCCNREDMGSDYKMGPVVDRVRERYNLPKWDAPSPQSNGIEMGNRSTDLR